jgi:hypothetical protein
MGNLSESDRERVLAKARADAARQGLPEDIEDASFRRKVGGLLIDVKDRLRKIPRSGTEPNPGVIRSAEQGRGPERIGDQ